MDIFGDLLFGIEFLDDLDIIGIGGLEMDITFQRFFYHETENANSWYSNNKNTSLRICVS